MYNKVSNKNKNMGGVVSKFVNVENLKISTKIKIEKNPCRNGDLFVNESPFLNRKIANIPILEFWSLKKKVKWHLLDFIICIMFFHEIYSNNAAK